MTDHEQRDSGCACPSEQAAGQDQNCALTTCPVHGDEGVTTTEHMIRPDGTLTPMRRRYGYCLLVSVEEWAQTGTLVLDRFHRELDRQCEERGHPHPDPSCVHQVIGLRLNSEGARDDRGELPRVECSPKDPRAVEIKIRREWSA